MNVNRSTKLRHIFLALCYGKAVATRRVFHNGTADKASDVSILTVTIAFSRHSLYPPVGGSAAGTIKRMRRTAVPLAEIGRTGMRSMKLFRAGGIFANVEVLLSVWELAAQKLN